MIIQSMFHPINVGICSCTDLYHGAMEGHEVIVSELTEHRYFGWHYFVPLKTPLVFRIREVRIPERHEREVLEREGCNFFVDVHTGPKGTRYGRISLMMTNPIPENPAGSDKIYAPELDASGIGWCEWMQKTWPPTVHEVEEGMSQLIRRMDEQGLYQWLGLVALNTQASVA